MREQVGTGEGEKEDIEQAQGKVDNVNETQHGKRDVVMRESAVPHDR
jgi:hypothetical protein